MRYWKGSIRLGQEHDYPILRQILRSHPSLMPNSSSSCGLAPYER